jgi:hypothetical protein
MLLGQIKSLGGNKGSSDVNQSHSSPVVDAEDDEGSDGFSNVPLSSDEDSRKSGKSPQQSPSMMFGRPKSTGADGSGNHDDPHREGILGQIKSTTLSAGNAVVNTTKTAGSTVVHTTTQAGAALVGGLKATTNLLNPMNIGKPRETTDPAEPEVDQRKIDEEFSKIEIEDTPEEPEHTAPKAGFFDQLKQKTGLAPSNSGAAHSSDPSRRPSSSTSKKMFHHEERMEVERTHHHGEVARGAVTVGEAPKESFMDQFKHKTGLAKPNDDIAHDSAPKEGFLDHLKVVNPFAASQEPPKRTVVPPPKRQSSTAQSGSGITTIFDSFSGKSDPPKRQEPAKQTSMFGNLTGSSSGTSTTKKEAGFFDSLTGSGSTTNKSSGGPGLW